MSPLRTKVSKSPSQKGKKDMPVTPIALKKTPQINKNETITVKPTAYYERMRMIGQSPALEYYNRTNYFPAGFDPYKPHYYP